MSVWAEAVHRQARVVAFTSSILRHERFPVAVPVVHNSQRVSKDRTHDSDVAGIR